MPSQFERNMELAGDYRKKQMGIKAEFDIANDLKLADANNSAAHERVRQQTEAQKEIADAQNKAENERAKPGMEAQSIKNRILDKFGEAAAETELTSAKTKLSDDTNTAAMNKQFGPLTKQAAIDSQKALTEDLMSDLKTEKNTKRVAELNKGGAVFVENELNARNTNAVMKAAEQAESAKVNFDPFGRNTGGAENSEYIDKMLPELGDKPRSTLEKIVTRTIPFSAAQQASKLKQRYLARPR